MGISVSFPGSWCSAGVDAQGIPSPTENMEVTVSFPKSLCSAGVDAQDIPFQCEDNVVNSAALDAQDIPFQCEDNVVNSAGVDTQDIPCPFQCEDNVVNVGNIKAELQKELSIFSEQKKKKINALIDMLRVIKNDGIMIGGRKRGTGEQSLTARKKVRQEEDLSARKDLPDDPHEKLSVLHELYAKATSNKSSLTGGAKVFYYNTLKPIETCLMQHFQGDRERFLEKWKSLTGDLYRFNAQCCSGKTICGETMGKAQ
jgi:hypothetical protein